MSTIGLFGAAGAIGKSIGVALRAESRPYRVVGRSRAGLEHAFGGDPLAHIATWDLNDPASIRNAMRGVDTLVYLVGVPYNHFELHPQLTRKTLAGAIDEEVAASSTARDVSTASRDSPFIRTLASPSATEPFPISVPHKTAKKANARERITPPPAINQKGLREPDSTDQMELFSINVG